ncbi:MAG: hypothetical protein O2960_29765 [Verrucomicrobia bacterium]|nr:hypothetical protein [Verrucomicrobiota bacterium]
MNSTTHPLTPLSEKSGLLDEGKLLAKLPVSRRTLYALRKRGLPHIVPPGGRRVLYSWDSVTAWLRRHERGGAQ